jgi:probable GTP-binding protein engB
MVSGGFTGIAQRKQLQEEEQKKLTEQWEELPPHFVSSSEKKTGRQEILDYIDSINRSLKA